MESAVTFETPTRVHVALTVSDLARAVPFYEALLAGAPTKRRPGYAKFEVESPPVNLTLNEVPGHAVALGPASHFGIQVKSTAEVEAWQARMTGAGFDAQPEMHTACCYALQDKVWVHDPDGHRWEVFVVLEADVAEDGRVEASACCPDAPAAAETACCPDARENVESGSACC